MPDVTVDPATVAVAQIMYEDAVALRRASVVVRSRNITRRGRPTLTAGAIAVILEELAAQIDDELRVILRARAGP